MKRRLFATLCLLLAAGFAGLGVWQVERRAWKLDLIARVDARVHAAAVALPPRARWGDNLAYTRVRMDGVFLPGADTRVQAVTERGPGWWLLTPMRTAGVIVLVNRGFVPPDWRANAVLVARNATVTGLIRTSEPGGAFLRANDPAAGRWYSRDVAAIARARGLGPVAPFFVDADDTPGGYPVGGLTVVSFRNAHLAYALTWFALAALSLFGGWRLVRERP